MLKPFEAVVEPVFEIANKVVVAFAAVVLEIKKIFAFVSPLFCEIDNLAHGVEVPMPMLPAAVAVKTVLLVPSTLVRIINDVVPVESTFLPTMKSLPLPEPRYRPPKVLLPLLLFQMVAIAPEYFGSPLI